jgi:photosystem II stability/assembly factor-like uncharacterized protein
MKSFTTALTVFLLFALNTYARWEVQNPLPQGNTLTKIKFATKTTGWAVGYNGTIVKTTNAGLNWIAQNSNVSDSLIGFFCMDSLNAWACGGNGTILKTNNGGKSWNNENSLTKNLLLSIAFYNHDYGIAVGINGIIIRTTDGGSTWSELDSVTDKTLYNVSILNDKTYCISGQGIILRTTDSGKTWSTQQSENFQDLYDQNFIDSKSGWAVGGLLVQKTTDGGLTWKKQLAGIYSLLKSVFFCDSLRGWAVGQYGRVVKTTNGGMMWDSVNLEGWPYHYTFLYSVFFIDTSIGFITAQNGIIYKTTDGGVNWNVFNKKLPIGSLYHIAFVDSKTGWLSGSNGLLKTTNGGKEWIKQFDKLLDNKSIIDFSIIDINNIILLSYSHIIKTTDGGRKWSSYPINCYDDRTVLFKIFFIDSLNGWLSGYHDDPSRNGHQGVIFKTTNGGSNWSCQFINTGITGNTFCDLYFTDLNNGWTIGPSAIYKTNDGGTSWTQYWENGKTFYDIFYLNPQNFWLSGYDYSKEALLLKSTDGGLSWADKANSLKFSINSVSFTDSLNGWVLSKEGQIFKTTDGGDSWVNDNSPLFTESNNFYFNRIYFFNKSSGWALSNNGSLLHYTAGIASPLLDIPEDNIHADTSGILLAWFRVSNADNYQVRVSDSSGFKNILADEVTSGISYVFNQLEKNRTYYWSVRAMNSKDTSAWSETRSFNTLPETSVPEYYYPDEQVLVYPNPTDGIVSINFNKDMVKAHVKVYDVMGALAFSEEFNDLQKGRTLSLNLSSLNPGMYYLILNVNGTQYSRCLSVIK